MKHYTVALLTITFLLLAQSVQAAELATAKVLKVTGDVLKYSSGGGSKTLQEGDLIKEGDGITTSFYSSVDLIFSNGTELTVLENSSLSFEEMAQEPFSGDLTYDELTADPSQSQTLLQLNYGQVDGHVKKLRKDSNFEVNTPLGTAAIRGTVFRVAITFDLTTGNISLNITNFDGLVDLLTPFVEDSDAVEYDLDLTSDNEVSSDLNSTDLPSLDSKTCSIPTQHTVNIIIKADNPVFSNLLDKKKNVSPKDSIAVAAISGDVAAVAQELDDAGIEVSSPEEAAAVAEAIVSTAVSSAKPSDSAETTEVATNTVIQAIAGIAADTETNIVEVVEAASSGATAGAVEAAIDAGANTQQVAAAIESASSGASSGAIEAAVNSAADINNDGVVDSRDVVEVVEAASSGATAGAVEAAVDAGANTQQIDSAIESASSGASSGAIEAAVNSAADINNDGVVDSRDVVEVVEAASSGATAGAVEAAVEAGANSQQVAAAVESASSGATSGAVQAAVDTGTDAIDVAEAASSGATSGAIEAAVDTGSSVTDAAEAASSGSTTGAIEGAEASGADVNTVADAASAGATTGAVEGAESSGANVTDVVDAATTGSNDAQDAAGTNTDTDTGEGPVVTPEDDPTVQVPSGSERSPENRD
jgi:hypothetical protein